MRKRADNAFLQKRYVAPGIQHEQQFEKIRFHVSQRRQELTFNLPGVKGE